ncbi:FtsX-like permease family protein [Paenibacillus ihumii]|uniref:FtsX-like permease family protein n=1 Tax=Paenibacillus ihumii TaxID=687436 RepID=UPI0011DDA9EB
MENAGAGFANCSGDCILFFIFFVIYSVGSFLQSRKREFGILRLHGMTVKQLDRMLFLENAAIGAASMITGLAAGLISAKLFLMAGRACWASISSAFTFPGPLCC